MMVFSFKFTSDQFKMATKSASGSVGKVSGGPAGAFWMALLSFGSCDRLRPQSSQPNQVVGCPDEGEPPTHFLQTSQLHLLQQANHLHPAERLFHALAFLLADGIPRVPRRASVNRARPACRVLRHVRRGLPGIFAAISKAASRSAVPSACVTIAFISNPLRFSISTCPK